MKMITKGSPATPEVAQQKMENQTAKGICIMLCSSACVCVGQLLWKLSSGQNLFLLAAGFAVYALGALLMLYAYRFGKLSVLQPILSVNYVLSTVLGVLVLRESFSLKMLIGIVIIIAGVVLLGSSTSSAGKEEK